MITVQHATLNDFVFIGKIHGRAAFPASDNYPFKHKILTDESELKQTRQVLCAKEGFYIYGYVAFQIKNNVVVWVNDLCVDPQEQHKGVATLLMHKVEDFAENSACLMVAMETEQNNIKAIQFLDKNDYIRANDLLEQHPYHYLKGRTSPFNKPIMAKVI